MKRFHFRLEALLNFRKMKQEEAQLRFMEACNELQREQDLLAGLEQEEQDQLVEFQNFQRRKGLTVDSLLLFSNYFDRLKEQITEAANRVATAEDKRQAAMKQLEEAVKSHKVVENLRKKRLAEYRLELLQEEQKELDEMGTQIFLRGSEG